MSKEYKEVWLSFGFMVTLMILFLIVIKVNNQNPEFFSNLAVQIFEYFTKVLYRSYYIFVILVFGN